MRRHGTKAVQQFVRRISKVVAAAGIASAAGVVLAVPAGAAQPIEPQVVGPVHLSDAGDSVRLRYQCSEASDVYVIVSQSTASEHTGRYPTPLTCSGHVEVTSFRLENLPPGNTPELQKGTASARIVIYKHKSPSEPGAPIELSETHQSVKVIGTH